MKISVLQRKAIERAVEETASLREAISVGGECELSGHSYDFASCSLIEIKHWLTAILEDSNETISERD